MFLPFKTHSQQEYMKENHEQDVFQYHDQTFA